MQRLKLGLLVVLAMVMAALLLFKSSWVSGPEYWPWQERLLSPLPLFGGMALAFMPLLLAQFVNRRRWWGIALALMLLVLGCFAMKLNMALSRTDFTGLNYVREVSADPLVNGYYVDAVEFSHEPLRQWMGEFAQRMPRLTMHAQSKPPGPILYWYFWVRLLGPGDRTIIVGGLVLGLLGALGIVATYALLCHLLSDEPAAFAGASFMALCPGFVLFFPMFDPAYVLLSAALIGSWALSLRTNRAGYAVCTGIITAISLLVAFNVLVVGIFMIGLILLGSGSWSQRLQIGFRQALIAAAASVATLIGLWLVIRYDVISVFITAWQDQHQLLALHADERPYPATIVFDLTDFALGVGWIGYLLALFYFTQKDRAQRKWLAWLAIAQLLIVAITGLLQSETSRVWNFMLPLLMVPVGLELARWDRRSRIVCYGALAVLTTVIYEKLTLLL